MPIESAGLTDVGMRRSHNEDAYDLLPEAGLFVVADGMGGHAAGEVASRIAVEGVTAPFRDEVSEDALPSTPEDASLPGPSRRLVGAVRLANARIQDEARKLGVAGGMGTTVVAVLFAGDEAAVAHVGDSRVYRYRTGTLEQLTEDHSLLNEYRKARALTDEEIEAFPMKNIIVRALGMKPEVEVDVQQQALRPGDLFLLCSDGLSGMVSDPDIAHILGEHRDDLDAACAALVAAANAAGGKDNVTAVLARAS